MTRKKTQLKKHDSLPVHTTPGYLSIEGTNYVTQIRPREPWKAENDNEIRTAMPGVILKVVTPGEKVKKGDILYVIESMKMENRIECPFDVTIKKVHVEKGQSVAKDALILEFE